MGAAGAKALCSEKQVQSGGWEGALGGRSGDSGLEVSWGGRLREALGGWGAVRVWLWAKGRPLWGRA